MGAWFWGCARMVGAQQAARRQRPEETRPGAAGTAPQSATVAALGHTSSPGQCRSIGVAGEWAPPPPHFFTTKKLRDGRPSRYVAAVTAYEVCLYLHSYLRWVVLALLVVVVARAARGRAWTPADEGIHVAAVASVDLQLLLGLVLYVGLSPITSAFFSAPGASMRDTTLRFFGVEHLTSMALGIIALHVGRARSKRVPGEHRQKTVLRWTLAALVCVLIGVPWPFLRYGRPLARMGETTATPVEGACPPSYAARCATCHGAAGRGDGIVASTLVPPPRDFTALELRSDDELGAVIHDGGAAHGLSAAMPAHGDLSAEELAELVACVRSFRSEPPASP